MNELTLEEQRLLTEFLGELWHEWMYPNNDPTYQYPPHCQKCGTTKFTLPLDFSDWRVVGRLIEKILTFSSYETLKEHGGSESYLVLLHTKNKTFNGVATTQQLAICLAVLAYLEDK